MRLVVKRDFIFFLLISIFLSLVVGNRGDTNDTSIYYSIFKNIDNFNLSDYISFYNETGVEIGWGWYSKIISFFSESSVVLFTFFSFLIFLILYRISEIIKIKYIYILYFYLPTGFFLIQQFMQIRQALAIPLVIYGAVSFLSGNKKTSVILFFFAVMFHQVSIAFILVFLLYLLLTKYYTLGYSVSRFIIVNIVIVVVGFFLARTIFLPLASNFFDRIETYSSTDYAENVGFFSLANIKFYIEFLMILILVNRKLLANNFFVFFVCCFTVGLTLRLAFFDFAILSGRLSNVFLFVEIFLIPILLLNRLSIQTFYFYAFSYFVLLLYVTWNFQAAQFLESAYFIPLN